jgi:hypothetical protein
MQQTNDALQELNNTRVLTEADQVRFVDDVLLAQRMIRVGSFSDARKP